MNFHYRKLFYRLDAGQICYICDANLSEYCQGKTILEALDLGLICHFRKWNGTRKLICPLCLIVLKESMEVYLKLHGKEITIT
ncbi:MAG: hypothetical protein ABI340_02830 [Nitrososphaera sp.]